MKSLRSLNALFFLAGLALVLAVALVPAGFAVFTDTASVPSNTFTTAASFAEPTFYLHNNPTPPTGDTTSQLNLPLDTTAPTATTLYNYDTDIDSSAGRAISSGGSGATETDLALHQAWRTTALASPLRIGDVTVTLWSAIKDFQLNKAGDVTVYLRDYDGASYTEICNGTLTEADWAGGSGTWLQKTISFTCLRYNIPVGNQLEVKLIVNAGAGDSMWFAYDTTSYDSRVEFPEPARDHYLHNNPTPPTGDTTSQLDLPLDVTAPTATTLYNYDTDRDSSPGLKVNAGGSGAAETDATKYQAWRTAALPASRIPSGTVNVHLWSAMKDFNTGVAGEVTVFLRDYNGASYTEICNGTLTEADWAGGSGTWVLKSFSFSCASYTIPAGNFLEVKLIVGSGAADSMLFAYDTTSYDSRVELP